MLNPARQKFAAMPLYLLVLGFVLLPFVFSTSTLDYTLAPRFTFLGVLLVSLSFFQIIIKSRGQSVLKFTWPFVAFIVLETLSLFWAHTPSEGVVVLLRDVGLLMFLVLVVNICQNDNSTITISKALLLTNAIIGSYGLYQLFAKNALVDEARLYEVISLLAHRNLFASALILTLPFVVFVAWQSRGLWRWAGLVVFAHSCFLVFVLESRTAWLALFVFIAAYPVWILLEKAVSIVKIQMWRTVFISLLVLVLAVFSWNYFTKDMGEQRGQKLESGLGLSTENEKNFTIDERVMLWKGTLRMVWSEGFGGVGAGNWKIVFPAYGSDLWRARQGMVQFQRPHNDYLWVLSEVGILGLLAYASGFLLIMFYGVKAAANYQLAQNERVMIRLLLSGVLAYMVVAFFSFPRERVFHQIMLYTMLGLLVYLSRPSFFSKNYPAQLLRIFTIFLGGMMTWLGINWWQGEYITRKINEARAQGNWKDLLEHYRKVEQNPVYKIDAVSLPLSFYSGLAYLNLQEYQKSQREFAQAYNLHPNNIHVVNNMANIYFLQGKTDSAIVYYNKALQVSPKYLDGALNLMAAYFNTQQIDKAYNLLRRYEATFKDENPNHPTLQTYRMAILNAKKTSLQNEAKDERVKTYLQQLKDEELEALHFESLKQGVTLAQLIGEVAP